MRLTLAAVAAILLLAGCADEHEGEHCVESHTVIVPITHQAGKTTWVQMVPIKSCDKWVPNKGS